MEINIELERKKLELKRVEVAQADMEFTILERRADIQRLEKNIGIQKARVKELAQQITEMEEKENV